MNKFFDVLDEPMPRSINRRPSQGSFLPGHAENHADSPDPEQEAALREWHRQNRSRVLTRGESLFFRCCDALMMAAGTFILLWFGQCVIVALGRWIVAHLYLPY